MGKTITKAITYLINNVFYKNVGRIEIGSFCGLLAEMPRVGLKVAVKNESGHNPEQRAAQEYGKPRLALDIVVTFGLRVLRVVHKATTSMLPLPLIIGK